MLRQIGRRLATTIPSLIGVIIVTFLLTRVMPGDTAAYFAGPAATPQAIEDIRKSLGLDRPLPEQFVRYVRDLARGVLGNSLTTGRPVVTEIATRLPASAELTLLGLIVSMAIAVPLGILAAVKQGSMIDHACRVVATAGVSLPVFFTGLLLVYVFYFLVGWAPAPLGRLDVFHSAPPHVTGFYLIDSLIARDVEAFRASLAQLALPVITIALTSCLSRSAAQLTVFDPVNYQENLLSAARALQQINNQVRQLQGEAQMLARMEQNLIKLDGSIHPELQRLLGAIQGHLQQGNAIALSLKATEGSYERLFPRGLSQSLSGDARLRAAQQRWEEEYAGLKRAAQLQGQIGDGIAVDSRLLGQAMDRSRVANGALEVAQAGNELTGLGVKQVLALQSLLAAQHRAETLKSARDLASEQEARQRFKTFLGPRAGERAQR